MSPRKSPIRHRVQSHTREGSPVRSFTRGRGRTPRRSKVVQETSWRPSWFKSLVVDAVYKWMKECQQDFPDEDIYQNVTGYFAAMLTWVGGNTIDEMCQGNENVVAFTLSALEDGRVAYRSHSSPHAVEKRIHACYYNAADLVRRDPDAELAFGIMYTKENTLHPTSKPNTHAFVIKDGKVIDPTIRHHRTSFVYVYDTIPKSVWSKWKHTPNDPLYDSREFEKYTFDRYAKYSGEFDIVGELKRKERKGVVS